MQVTRVGRWLARAPWWLRAGIGVAALLFGAALVLHPYGSIEILVLLAGLGAIVTGVSDLIAREAPPARRWTGVGWVIVGLTIVLWPGLAVQNLAYVLGGALVLAGLIDLLGLWRPAPPSDRAPRLLGALASIAFGVTVLFWPDVTVFLIALLFGLRTAWFGVTELVAAVRTLRGQGASEGSPNRRRRRWPAEVALRSMGLAVAVLLLGATLAEQAHLHSIPSFYSWSAAIPTQPGRLLRVESYPHQIPTGSRGWLILYSTRTALGTPAVASAIVLVPQASASTPRPLVLWDHGTTGIAQRCAPSLAPDPFGDLPAVGDAVARGWDVVAPDYAGMGTTGQSPYLIGAGEAYSALDAARAAHQLPTSDLDAGLSWKTVIWGHSQGGHAALWTAILAPSYAPALTVVGVAAISPATDLLALAKAVEGHTGGALAAAYVITAYAATFPDVRLSEYIRPGARANVAAAAQRCTTEAGLLASIVTSLPARQSVFLRSPDSGPAATRLEQNTPTAHIGVPLLVAQGSADEVIPVSITEQWAAQRCAAGQHLDLRIYPGLTHAGILAASAPFTPQLLSWTAARLAGDRAPRTC